MSSESSDSVRYGEILEWSGICYLLRKDSAPWSKLISVFIPLIVYYKINFSLKCRLEKLSTALRRVQFLQIFK
jgi:hypothetical protein